MQTRFQKPPLEHAVHVVVGHGNRSEVVLLSDRRTEEGIVLVGAVDADGAHVIAKDELQIVADGYFAVFAGKTQKDNRSGSGSTKSLPLNSCASFEDDCRVASHGG